MSICKNLKAYIQLSREDKLRICLDEHAAMEIKVVDNGSPLVDLKQLDEQHVLAFNNAAGKDFFLRREAAENLIQTGTRMLNKGFRLKVYDAYRTFANQKAVFDQEYKKNRDRFQNLTEEDIWLKTTTTVADPTLCPPHLTGGAVDIQLIDLKNNHPVDMGSEIYVLDDPKSYLMSPDISSWQAENRLILMNVMTAGRYAPLASEWWHWSYGERYWAAFYSVDGNVSDAFYDVIKKCG